MARSACPPNNRTGPGLERTPAIPLRTPVSGPGAASPSRVDPSDYLDRFRLAERLWRALDHDRTRARPYDTARWERGRTRARRLYDRGFAAARDTRDRDRPCSSTRRRYGGGPGRRGEPHRAGRGARRSARYAAVPGP